MQKSSFLLFAILSIVFLSSKDNNLKGRVKSLISTSYRVKWDSVAGTPKTVFEQKQIKEFDTAGNLILYERCMETFCLTKFISLYDNGGNPVEQRTYERPPQNKINYTIAKLLFDPDSFTTLWQRKSTFLYDSAGRLLEKKTFKRFFTEDSVLTDYTIYMFDSLGHCTRLDSIRTGGTKLAKTTDGLRDSIILIPLSATLIPDDSINIKPLITYKYYRNGSVKERLIAQYNGDKDIRKYDKKGNLVEYGSISSDGKIFERYLIGFDKRGHEFSKEYNAKGLVGITLHKYTYDKIGNWTIDSTFTNDTLTYIRTQQFEYYR